MICLLLSCIASLSPLWQMFTDRDMSPTYRAKVPHDWVTQPPVSKEQITDTTQPICAFLIDNDIRVTIHTFPSDHLDDRISPQAQIYRWQRQFDHLKPESVSITAQAFSGYVGLLFEGSGLRNNKTITMLAWSMQLAPEHYQMLHERQKRADFTIKAVGPAELIAQHKASLIAFARSFELIQEIPNRP